MIMAIQNLITGAQHLKITRERYVCMIAAGSVDENIGAFSLFLPQQRAKSRLASRGGGFHEWSVV